jgi:hypothetical protein
MNCRMAHVMLAFISASDHSILKSVDLDRVEFVN